MPNTHYLRKVVALRRVETISSVLMYIPGTLLCACSVASGIGVLLAPPGALVLVWGLFAFALIHTIGYGAMVRVWIHHRRQARSQQDEPESPLSLVEELLAFRTRELFWSTDKRVLGVVALSFVAMTLASVALLAAAPNAWLRLVSEATLLMLGTGLLLGGASTILRLGFLRRRIRSLQADRVRLVDRLLAEAEAL